MIINPINHDSVMTTFQSDRLSKLSNYKKATLTTSKGLWRDMLYDHILPETQKKKNILETIRNDFWAYFKVVNIKLHPCFHHLNSSQALCFNLFFPLFHKDKRFLTFVLHQIIEVEPIYSTPKENINLLLSLEKNSVLSVNFTNELREEYLSKNCYITCEFEKIIDNSEMTNFDFFVQLQDGHRVLFEVKYLENNFGKVKNNDSYRNKYNRIYKPKLDKVIKTEYNNEVFILTNYQLIRNLSYVDDLTTVVFDIPDANKKLKGKTDLITKVLLPNKLKQVKVVYLEELIRQVLDEDYLSSLEPTFESFRKKYIE